MTAAPITRRAYTWSDGTPAELAELNLTDPAAYRVDPGPSLYLNAGTVRTRYAVRFADPAGRVRWHRIYATAYANASSLYVRHGRELAWLSTEAEHALEAARDAAAAEA